MATAVAKPRPQTPRCPACGHLLERRCVYCGRPTTKKGEACAAHLDLLAVDLRTERR